MYIETIKLFNFCKILFLKALHIKKQSFQVFSVFNTGLFQICLIRDMIKRALSYPWFNTVCRKEYGMFRVTFSILSRFNGHNLLTRSLEALFLFRRTNDLFRFELESKYF